MPNMSRYGNPPSPIATFSLERSINLNGWNWAGVNLNWIKQWHNDMAVLMFAFRIMIVQLCKLWTLSFGRTEGSNFVIKLTLDAKGVQSRASCYWLINFGTEWNECQHRIVHVNLISKFDSTSIFAG